MARKLLDSEEAAKTLGVSEGMLNEMREKREIYAVRDGGQWKYKPEEVERLKAERDEFGAVADDSADSGDSMESILLSEVALGDSTSPSSTIIGRSESATDDLIIADPSSPALGASDVRLAGASGIGKPGSGLSAKFDELDTLDLELPPAPESSKIGPGSDRLPGGPGSGVLPGLHDSGVLSQGPGSSKKHGGSGVLALGDDDILSLADEPSSKKSGHSSKKSGSGSSKRRMGGPDSSVDLSGDSDDIMLGGSGPGSDITHAAGDSGISLIDLSDSGLALDEAPPSISGPGSTGKNPLALSGEASDDDLILLEEEADPNVATQLKQEDEFLLTPMEESHSDDSDSGSQVIALDTDSEFDESSTTMLGGGNSASLLEEDGGFGAASFDEDPLGGDAAGIGTAPAAMSLGAPAPMMMMAPAQSQEAPFSGFYVSVLFMGIVVLSLCGMMMYDLMRNMWSWDGPYAVNSSLMDAIIEAWPFGK